MPTSHRSASVPIQPRNSPLFKRLEELCGPIPEPPEDPNIVYLPRSLVRPINLLFGSDSEAGLMLLLILGGWLRGETALETFTEPQLAHGADNRKTCRELEAVGLIVFSEQLCFATLNEDAVLAVVNEAVAVYGLTDWNISHESEADDE